MEAAIIAIIQISLFIINLYLAKMTFEQEKYKVAMFCSFASGSCLIGFLYAL